MEFYVAINLLIPPLKHFELSDRLAYSTLKKLEVLSFFRKFISTFSSRLTGYWTFSRNIFLKIFKL